MYDLELLTLNIGDLNEEKIKKSLTEFVSKNPSRTEANRALEACQAGLDMVQVLFEKGEYFVGDLIFSGKLLTEAIEFLKPFLSDATELSKGRILLGTVRHDLHDVGKNIFRYTAEAAGFEVLDLGIDVDSHEFVKKSIELKPDIIALSGVLTLAIDSMKEVVIELKAAKIKSKILIGGTPVSHEASKIVGADNFANNAIEGVNICLNWI